MYKSHLKGRFKRHLSLDQTMAMKVNKEFEKRKERLSNSYSGYRNKIKTIPDFELEHYDCGEPFEAMVKKYVAYIIPSISDVYRSL